MSAQPSLFNAPLPDEPARRKGAGVRQSFEDFHRDNPQVFELLRNKALALKRNGWCTFGMKALVESARWSGRLETNGKPYRLNNNHVAGYARLLMETTPELRGFFRLR